MQTALRHHFKEFRNALKNVLQLKLQLFIGIWYKGNHITFFRYSCMIFSCQRWYCCAGVSIELCSKDADNGTCNINTSLRYEEKVQYLSKSCQISFVHFVCAEYDSFPPKMPNVEIIKPVILLLFIVIQSNGFFNSI